MQKLLFLLTSSVHQSPRQCVCSFLFDKRFYNVLKNFPINVLYIFVVLRRRAALGYLQPPSRHGMSRCTAHTSHQRRKSLTSLNMMQNYRLHLQNAC